MGLSLEAVASLRGSDFMGSRLILTVHSGQGKQTVGMFSEHCGEVSPKSSSACWVIYLPHYPTQARGHRGELPFDNNLPNKY